MPTEAEEGHHTWTLGEVAKARDKFPVGTKMRLAIELINALAFRRSDVIRVGLPHTHAGHLDDGRPATFLKYTQHKNRETKPITVDVPIPAELLAVIKATKATGLKTWLIGAIGGCFTDQGLTDWFSEEMAKAGMPVRCTPHGLRKRCLTDMAEDGKTIHQIMSVSGHLTMKEVERYTRMADRARNARAAMAGRVEGITCDTSLCPPKANILCGDLHVRFVPKFGRLKFRTSLQVSYRLL